MMGGNLKSWLLPEQRNGASDLDKGRYSIIHVNRLLCLHKVGHVAIIVHTTGEEASTCAFTADARDETGLGLLVGGIYCADGHHPTDDFQQPVMTVHLVLPQRHMQ